MLRWGYKGPGEQHVLQTKYVPPTTYTCSHVRTPVHGEDLGNNMTIVITISIIIINMIIMVIIIIISVCIYIYMYIYIYIYISVKVYDISRWHHVISYKAGTSWCTTFECV